MAILHTGEVTAKPLVARALIEFGLADMKLAADRVLPYKSVGLQTGVLPVIQREDMLRIERTRRSPSATFGRVTYREKGIEFRCEDDGLEGLLPDEQRALYATSFDAELMAAQQVQGLCMLAREARVAASVFSATWTGGGATLYTDWSGAAPWTTAASDAVAHVEAAKEKVRLNSGTPANALVLNSTNCSRLRQLTVIRNMFPGAALITNAMLQEALAAIFGLQYLIECGAVYSSAAEGQAFVGANVWSNLYAMVARVCVTPDLSESGLGATFRWTAVDGQAGNTFNVVTYRQQDRKSDVVQVDQYTDEVILGTAYGHLMKIAAA